MKHGKRLKKRFLAVCGVIAIMASLIVGCCCTASAATYDGTIFNDTTGLPYQEGEGILDGLALGRITGSTYAINFYAVMLNNDSSNQPFFVPNIQGHEAKTEQLINGLLESVGYNGINMGITENTANNGAQWEMEYIDYITDATQENGFIESLILRQRNLGSEQTQPIVDRYGGDILGVMLRPYVYNYDTGTKMYLIYGDHYQVVNADNGPYMMITLSGDNIVNDFQVFGIEMQNYYSDYAYWDSNFPTYWSFGATDNPNGINGFEIDAQADYKTGYNIGYQNGNVNKQEYGAEKYQEGYFQGSSDAEEYSVYTLIEYIGNLPATFINSMLGFEVFGINVAMFVKVIFTLGVVAFVVFCLVKVILAFW